MRRLLAMALFGGGGGAQGPPSLGCIYDHGLKGVGVDSTVCQVLIDESAMFEWRSGGACWIMHPVAVSGL